MLRRLIMNSLALFILMTQMNSPMNISKPVISVTVDGYAESMFETNNYEIILYADVDDKVEKNAKKEAEDLKTAIKKAIKTMGGKENDATITNSNTYDPIEGDPYFRIEQDIKVMINNAKDIEEIKSKFLEIDGVQIGSVTPIVPEDIDYTEALKMSREDAVSKASEESMALAKAFKVMVGEPVFITESILYPNFDEYSTTTSGKLVVKMTVYYEMIYKK